MLKLITRLGVLALMLAIVAIPAAVNVTYAVTVTPEDTAVLCSDLIDNDEDLLTDMSDPDCAAFAPVVTPAPVILENTDIFCADGQDNDGDLLIDLSDPECTAFAPVATSTASTTPSVPENTAVLCADLIDNDQDLLTDMSDPDCAAFAPVATSTNPGTTTPQNPSNGGGSSFTQVTATGRSSGVTSFGLPNTPAVLGAATGPEGEEGATCTFYSLAYMKKGANNDANEVKKLQIFLNNFNNAGLAVTGFFGAETEAAVHALQTKYSSQILQPWANAGLMNPVASTGYVFKTTQWFINMQMCPSLNLAVPTLK